MLIEIKITADNTEDVNKVVSALADVFPKEKAPAKKERKPRGAKKPEPVVQSIDLSSEEHTPSTEKEPSPEEETPSPEEAPSTEEVTSGDPAKDKMKAVELLMPMYANAPREQKALIMGLAKKFGAAKFGEIPDDKGTELLAKAIELKAELDAA